MNILFRAEKSYLTEPVPQLMTLVHRRKRAFILTGLLLSVAIILLYKHLIMQKKFMNGCHQEPRLKLLKIWLKQMKILKTIKLGYYKLSTKRINVTRLEGFELGCQKQPFGDSFVPRKMVFVLLAPQERPFLQPGGIFHRKPQTGGNTFGPCFLFRQFKVPLNFIG